MATLPSVVVNTQSGPDRLLCIDHVDIGCRFLHHRKYKILPAQVSGVPVSTGALGNLGPCWSTSLKLHALATLK